MNLHVIDASAMGPLIFEDEAHGQIGLLPELLENGACIVPVHWHFEVANLLLAGVRRGRATAKEATTILDLLAALPVETDPKPLQRSWSGIYAIAAKHDLSFYDAAYLELAVRLSAPLLSFDKALIKAASVYSVKVLS